LIDSDSSFLFFCSLIADHMGWYKDWTNEAGGTTVEEMLASKGFKVDNRLRDWSPEDDEQVSDETCCDLQ
jgi:hypothetical protein